MAAPTVQFYGNTGSEGTPTWTEVVSGKRVAFCGTGGATNMTDAQIPNVTKPGSGTSTASEAWCETGTNTWAKVATYDGTVNANDNVFRWALSTNAPASGPIFTAYDSGGRTVTSAVLAGNATDTSSKSYIKACRTSGSLTSTVWTSATTGSAGAVTATDTGQSLQGDTQYLQDTSATTGNRQFNILFYVGVNLTAGTYTDRLSCKYTFT